MMLYLPFLDSYDSESVIITHHLALIYLNVPWQAMVYKMCTMKFPLILGGFLVYIILQRICMGGSK